MIIGTYHILEIGKKYGTTGDGIHRDGNFYQQPFIVIKEVTIKEYIQQLKDDGYSADYNFGKSSKFYEISLD